LPLGQSWMMTVLSKRARAICLPSGEKVAAKTIPCGDGSTAGFGAMDVSCAHGPDEGHDETHCPSCDRHDFPFAKWDERRVIAMLTVASDERKPAGVACDEAGQKSLLAENRRLRYRRAFHSVHVVS
jgi:hypothetical protein